MQMIRTVWEPAFGRPDYLPPGYFQVSWDSLAWNWEINVFNGKFIYWKDDFLHINLPTNPQRNWDSLYIPESDYTPDIPNKEDISVYGYYVGATRMKKIVSAVLWRDSVMTLFYVRDVRQYKHTEPWGE